MQTVEQNSCSDDFPTRVIYHTHCLHPTSICIPVHATQSLHLYQSVRVARSFTLGPFLTSACVVPSPFTEPSLCMRPGLRWFPRTYMELSPCIQCSLSLQPSPYIQSLSLHTTRSIQLNDCHTQDTDSLVTSWPLFVCLCGHNLFKP